MNRSMILLLSTCLATGVVMADELLGRPDLAALAEMQPPQGVTIALEENAGETVVRVTNTNAAPTSVSLSEVSLETFRGQRLDFVAAMASEDMAGNAYLEMWALRGSEAYFSRALNDTFTGTQAERTTSTPFFLTHDGPLDAVRLGIRFEGPGSVLLRDLALWERNGVMSNRWPGESSGMLVGIAGSIFGIGSGVWAGVAGLLAWKGVGRKGVLGVTMGLVVASIAALVAGFYLWTSGHAWAAWYPVVLLGGIGLLNFIAAYLVLRWWYGKAEARRMAAMDMR